jgi:hypothetical protein
MKTIYIVLDGVAVGPMEIDDDADTLKAVQNKYPKAKSADPHEQDSNVIIVSTDDDR